ncbi:O-antigen ligase family protein [Bradyrhizobium lablabi]|uniref:O-antigen ligase family protein n=1 Tax=Bradyrhizobium lablabi TaxID=722472 RepID=UPI001BA7663F|nr:O-antigen ligase family protein [Bradyrhizobium lablabi]MBR1120241.1 O-antigen ligase family protein [Bradyrhizobium lablabi]
MPALVFSAWRDPAARILNLDLLAVLLAILLPWTTSGVAIVSVLWLVALLPTIDLRAFVRLLRQPICYLPVALCAIAIAGTLWSDAAWGTRAYALTPLGKLLMLPPLLYHFQRSSRGLWVFVAFLASCSLLLAMSWIVALFPGLALKPEATYGVPVKNYIDQSQEFALCAVVLAYPVIERLRAGAKWSAMVLASVGLLFVINMIFVTVSRTALVTMPVMLAVFALLHLKWRANLAIFLALVVLAAVAWASSSRLQQTTETFYRDYYLYKLQDEPTSIGIRLEFLKKSLQFFAEAPVIGHGTGATRGLFEKAASDHNEGKVFASAQVIGNPHNQTLNVAVQWGIVGVIVLYAMWLYHLLLFRGEGLIAWIGLMVVVQNFFTSLFNSHLFDFHEGWMYVLGVGVAGGTVLGARLREKQSAESATGP